jgi:two-component system, NarL family, nitrate/nitrite response regulator NarL
MIQVFLVGSIRLNREGLASLLARDSRLHVTGHASTGEGVSVRSSIVDVIIVDTDVRDAPDAIERVIDDSDAPIVAMGLPDDEQNVIALAEMGVLGFVERGASLDDLVASVLSVARGEASMPPRIATIFLHRVSSLGARSSATDVTTLTLREREVVQLIAEGLSNKEIAGRLCIEFATVKNHVHNILEKLEVTRRSEAVARLRIVPSDANTSVTVPLAERSISRSRRG